MSLVKSSILLLTLIAITTISSVEAKINILTEDVVSSTTAYGLSGVNGVLLVTSAIVARNLSAEKNGEEAYHYEGIEVDALEFLANKEFKLEDSEILVQFRLDAIEIDPRLEGLEDIDFVKAALLIE